jgi:hypothetical protein
MTIDLRLLEIDNKIYHAIVSFWLEFCLEILPIKIELSFSEQRCWHNKQWRQKVDLLLWKSINSKIFWRMLNRMSLYCCLINVISIFEYASLSSYQDSLVVPINIDSGWFLLWKLLSQRFLVLKIRSSF